MEEVVLRQSRSRQEKYFEEDVVIRNAEDPEVLGFEGGWDGGEGLLEEGGGLLGGRAGEVEGVRGGFT